MSSSKEISLVNQNKFLEQASLSKVSPIRASVSQSPPVLLVGCPNIVLLKMLAEHRTGSLMFKDGKDLSVAWRVYLDQGKIVFAESSCGQRERLGYLLKLFVPGCPLEFPAKPVSSIYSLLCKIWSEHRYPVSRLQEVLAYSTQEALVQIFAIRKCEIVYDPSAYFPPVVKSSSFSALIDPIEPWISQWRGIRNEIKSPFQRFYIKDWDKFFNMISYARKRHQNLHQLNLGLGKNFTLYEFATHLNMNVRDLAVVLHPLIKAGAIGVRCFRDIRSLKRPLVASLNQKKFDRQLTRRTLERSGYDVLMLKDSKHLIQQLQEMKPRVTLLDSELSNVSGFDLCREIRKVDGLKNLPVVMLMREKHFMGGMRGQWAGANDCLTNPIRPQDLIKTVGRWNKVKKIG